MPIEHIASLVTAIIASLVAGATAIGVWINLKEKLAKLEVKVDTMWDFQMRRAMAEAVTKGVATMNSPLTIDEKTAMDWLGNLVLPLREFYGRFGKNLTDRDLMLAIERQFGNQIVRQVCVPHGLKDGSCLIIAAAVAKQDKVIEIDESDIAA